MMSEIISFLHYLVTLDKKLFLILNHDIANPYFDFFFVTITNAQFWIAPGIIAVLVFIFFGRKKALIVIGLALVTVTISDQVGLHLKHLVGRMRPCNPQDLVEGGRFLLGFKGRHDSFPSNHSINMFAQAALLTCFYRKQMLYFLVFACTIGLSRIYVGVHYPADVLAGAVFGAIIGWVVYLGYYKCMYLYKKRQKTQNENVHRHPNEAGAQEENVTSKEFL